MSSSPCIGPRRFGAGLLPPGVSLTHGVAHPLDREIDETRDLDENTTIDLDGAQNVVAITFEHASKRTDVRHITVEGVAA